MISNFFENSSPVVKLTKLRLVKNPGLAYGSRNALLLSRAGFCPDNHYVALTENNIMYPLTTNRIVYNYVRSRFLTPYQLNGDYRKKQYIIPIAHEFKSGDYRLEECNIAEKYYEEHQHIIEDEVAKIQAMYPKFALRDFEEFENHVDLHVLLSRSMHNDDRIG